MMSNTNQHRAGRADAPNAMALADTPAAWGRPADEAASCLACAVRTASGYAARAHSARCDKHQKLAAGTLLLPRWKNKRRWLPACAATTMLAVMLAVASAPVRADDAEARAAALVAKMTREEKIALWRRAVEWSKGWAL